MMEAEIVSEMLVCNSVITKLIPMETLFNLYINFTSFVQLILVEYLSLELNILCKDVSDYFAFSSSTPLPPDK
jgi:hypothetical protein